MGIERRTIARRPLRVRLHPLPPHRFVLRRASESSLITMAGAHLARRLAAMKNIRLWAKSNHAAALSTSSRVMYGGGGIPDDLPIKVDIGKREVVGYGVNGEESYMDDISFPFPAIRFKEDSAEIAMLREKEKGDWKKLTLEEKNSCTEPRSARRSPRSTRTPTSTEGNWVKSCFSSGSECGSTSGWSSSFTTSCQ